MDAENRFETRQNFLLARLEYWLVLLVSLALLVQHWSEVRWLPFIALFLYIDLIGYLPGAIVHRRRGGRVPAIFYRLYNLTHNYLSAGVVAVLWWLVVGPEWALLALPIHLMGDRAVFGNGFKTPKLSFEGAPHDEFVQFEKRV